MQTPDSIQSKLDQRKENGSLRELAICDGKIDFFSNDYLGIARINSQQTKGHGSTGSRLISGHSKEIDLLESSLAKFFGADTSLLFNSGYDANLGFYSSVPQRNDIVIYDSLCHASIRDGIRLGLAKSYSFRHNEVGHLKELLEKCSGTIYVAIESIYSMDGDEAPLNEIAELCEIYNAYLVVDEAHSGGIYGHEGRGLVSEYGLNNKVFAKLITFGKTYGSHGAAIMGDEILKQYLINFSRPLIYSTALSPASVSRINEAVTLVKGMNRQRDDLNEKIKFFKENVQLINYDVINSNSPIQSVIIPTNEEASRIAKRCNESGFAVKAIMSPTVPLGLERIRVCLHSYNTIEEIRNLIECLK